MSLAETICVARDTSVSASRPYKRVDGISEGNKLRDIGIHSTETAVGTAPAELPMSQSDDTVMNEAPVNFDVSAVAACTGYKSDSSDSTSAVLHRLRCGCKDKGETPSMTQVGLEQLRGDIEDLTDGLAWS